MYSDSITLLKRSYCLVLIMMTLGAVAAPTVTKISAGGSHSLIVKSDGSLWGMGDNSLGQLGAGFGLTQTNRPILIVSSNVTQIAAGYTHSLFRQGLGSLWAMGDNFYGELGDNAIANHYFPEQIVATDVNSIAAGNGFSVFTKFHVGIGPGSFWAMGKNGQGVYGNGTTTSTNVPQLIFSTPGAFAATALAAGGNDILFVKPNGSLWGMGDDASGELGDGNNFPRTNMVQILASGVSTVSVGEVHTLYIKTDGSLWGMGNNAYGEIGDNSTGIQNTPEQLQFNGVTAVSAGFEFSLFLKADGSLWGMGRNDLGQLGDGTLTNRILPVLIVASNVTAIAAGGGHSLFLKSNGSLWGMGYNFNGQLGDGTYTNRNVPVLILPGLAVPGIRSLGLSGSNLVVNATNGVNGGTYHTLMSTDLTMPLNQWSPVATNVLAADGDFSFTITNTVSRAIPRRFYVLQLQ